MIEKLKIFDFDKTFVKTLDKEEGIAEWEKASGEKYPHLGWFGRLESLDPILKTEINYDVALHAVDSLSKKGHVNILLTGRIPKFHARIKEILEANNLAIFDEYLLNNQSTTLSFKLNMIEELFKKYMPNTMEIFEDRYDHCFHFYKLSKRLLGRNAILHYVCNGKVRQYTMIDYLFFYMKSKLIVVKKKLLSIFA